MKFRSALFAVMLLLSWGVAAQNNEADSDSDFYKGVIAYRKYNFDEAAAWFLKAAERGDVDAQFLLGRMHYDGNSLTVDQVTAYMWFDIAAGHGMRVGARYRNGIARDMTDKEITLAKERADEWRRVHPGAGPKAE